MEPRVKSRFEMPIASKEHEMHHRGQLMVVERMPGITPHLTRHMEERIAAMQSAQASRQASGDWRRLNVADLSWRVTLSGNRHARLQAELSHPLTFAPHRWASPPTSWRRAIRLTPNPHATAGLHTPPGRMA